MHFTANRNALLEAIRTVRAFAGKNGPLDIDVTADSVTVWKSAEPPRQIGQTTAAVSVPATDTEPGSFTVPAGLTKKLLKAATAETVTVTGGCDLCQITAGGYSAAIRLHDLDPQGDALVLADPDVTVTVPNAVLAQAIQLAAPAASSDESLPLLTGVCWEREDGHLRLVATDSYRLVVLDVPEVELPDGWEAIVVPSLALEALADRLDPEGKTTLNMQGGERPMIWFDSGNLHATTALLTMGQQPKAARPFPNYRPLIPDTTPGTLTVDAETLVAAVKQVAVLTMNEKPIRFELEATSTAVRVVNPYYGSITATPLGTTYTGEPLTVALNTRYLLDAIDGVTGDVTIGTRSSPSPGPTSSCPASTSMSRSTAALPEPGCVSCAPSTPWPTR